MAAGRDRDGQAKHWAHKALLHSGLVVDSGSFSHLPGSGFEDDLLELPLLGGSRADIGGEKEKDKLPAFPEAGQRNP